MALRLAKHKRATRGKSTDRVAKHRRLARDITYAAPADLARRRRLEKDLLKWLKYYGAELFPLPWADFHIRAIKDLQYALTHSGNFARALPRGSGKTTILKLASLWAIVCGHRTYGILVGSTVTKAKALLKDIKTILRFNDRLAADYPEVCGPIRALEGVALRTRTQTAFGKSTLIEWKIDRLQLPDTPRLTKTGTKEPNPAAGAILDADGITGDIRGHVVVKTDGTSIRPDFALCDDPQTRQSAKSFEQTKFRLGVIKSDVAASAGPGKDLTVMVACTVIIKGDLSDLLLDQEKHPEFHSERMGLIVKWPDDMDAWEKGYAKAWKSGLRAKDKGKAANTYYKRHRKRLDAGAVISWPARKRPTEISGVQHAMNLYFELKKTGFCAEYQNQPLDEVQSVYDLTVEHVAGAVNGLTRRQVPENASILVGFVDINLYGLSWTLAASNNQRAISILDYGIFPGQERMIWTKESTEPEELAIARALSQLDAAFRTLQFTREKEPVPIDLLLIDVGARWMQAVFDWINGAGRASPLPWHASRGWSNKSYSPGKSRVGRPGEQWHKARWSGKGRVYVHNADYWRMQTQKGFFLPAGAPGSQSLFGKESDSHLELARQVTSERLLRYVRGDIKDTYEWSNPDHRNDFGDALVGCNVAASIQGATPHEEASQEEDDTQTQDSPKKAELRAVRNRATARTRNAARGRRKGKSGRGGSFATSY